MYAGSADLMNRNLDRRVEILFPIESPRLRERVIREVIELSLTDNTKMRWLEPDGTYIRRRNPDESRHDMQNYLLKHSGF